MSPPAPAANAGGSPAAAEPVTITVHTFGGGENFGYDKAVETWNAAHPNIQVKYQNLTDRFEDVYLPQLLQRLQASSGAADIIAVDEGAMGLMKARPQFFTDLAEYGLESRKADFPAGSGTTASTPTTSCSASAPTSAAWPCATARTCSRRPACPPTARRSASSGPTGTTSWRPARSSRPPTPARATPSSSTAPNTLYNVILTQEAPKNGNVTYFDKSNKLVIETNPAVKTAFDTMKSFTRRA